jgi:hypothetical protein
VKHIDEPARKTPVMAETDVLVVGSGPGGLSAALASAREGVDTMLVERHGCFGGVITQTMVGTLAWYRTSPDTVDAGGLGVEYERRAKDRGASISVKRYEIVDTEVFKLIADDMVQEAGITPLLHCAFADVIMEGDAIKGVITESKSGRQAILAKRVIDATGDADIACRAGVPYHQDAKEKLSAVTVNFGCSGVDLEKFFNYSFRVKPKSLCDSGAKSGEKEKKEISTRLVEPYEKARKAGEMPEHVRMGGQWNGFTDKGEVTSLNAIRVMGVDPTNVWDLTRGEIEGRQHVVWAVNALKKYAPGFEEARLRTISASIGTRESRKIVGHYHLTEEDVLNQACFDDSIGICAEFLDGSGYVVMPSTGRYFHVPYGIILPQKVDNLLVAGRSVAGDKVSHAATRQMMCCAVTGQGAGVAAAVSVKDKVSCAEVNISKVQQALEKQDVRVS